MSLIFSFKYNSGHLSFRMECFLGVHCNAKETIWIATPRSHASWALLKAVTSACLPRRLSTRQGGMNMCNAQEARFLGGPNLLRSRCVLGVPRDAQEALIRTTPRGHVSQACMPSHSGDSPWACLATPGDIILCNATESCFLGVPYGKVVHCVMCPWR